MKRLSTRQGDFDAQLNALLAFETAQNPDVDAAVARILDDVKQRGDDAVVEYTSRFDGLNVRNMVDLELDKSTLKAAFTRLSTEQRSALEAAAERVRRYHERQVQHSWQYTEDDGTVLGQAVTPLDRVGLYVPGGKASYPSSVLMNALPAKVAGVGEILMVVPTPRGERNDLVFAAA
ncbi:MAG: histidinol dehydrogenase, partial [Burkholderiales bacterium]|nr:histidinol dehydrogenase [Burkholderiales bacterium]